MLATLLLTPSLLPSSPHRLIAPPLRASRLAMVVTEEKPPTKGVVVPAASAAAAKVPEQEDYIAVTLESMADPNGSAGEALALVIGYLALGVGVYTVAGTLCGLSIISVQNVDSCIFISHRVL